MRIAPNLHVTPTIRHDFRVSRLAIAVALLLAAGPAFGDGLPPSRSDWGAVGLLLTPTARMLPDGAVGGGLTMVGSEYRHLFASAQLLPWLEVTARSTLYPNDWGLVDPGLDVKLRLLREGAWWPALAVGGRDVTGAGFDLPGEGRFAGEYVVLSRRVWTVDNSLGVGWGRLGGDDRDGAGPRGPRAWFTGRPAPFGGLEWHTPLSGLSLKVEASADRQRDDPGAAPGWPVNAGLAWRPLPWLDLGAGVEQGRRVMLRAAVTLDPRRLGAEPPPSPPRVGPRPAGRPATAAEMVNAARAAALPARAAVVEPDRAVLWLEPDDDLPARAVGRAARVLADGAPADVETLTIATGADGLDGVAVSVQRADLERALRSRGSPEELWRTTTVEPAAAAGPSPDWPAHARLAIRPTLEQSLFEQGALMAGRGYADAVLTYRPVRGVALGGGVRANLWSRLGDLDSGALPAPEPVRSDVALYAERRVGLEHLHASWLGTPAPHWHLRLSAGQFEEMFGGLGGEVLYRPLAARWALGLDLNRVWKRPPWEPLRVDAATGRSTGHASLYWEAPGAARSAALRLGRYLGGDWGGTAEVGHRFGNGVRLAAHLTWTDGPRRGQSRLGGRLEQGLALTLPLGMDDVLPGGAAQAAVRTLGRDAGQRLRAPLPLYETAVPAGFGRLAGTWSRVLD